MLDIIVIALIVLVVARTVTYAIVKGNELAKESVRCNERGLPHQWERIEQPWEGMEGEPPCYLQCKRCKCIFGQD
jgi:hypothetical protein